MYEFNFAYIVLIFILCTWTAPLGKTMSVATQDTQDDFTVAKEVVTIISEPDIGPKFNASFENTSHGRSFAGKWLLSVLDTKLSNGNFNLTEILEHVKLNLLGRIQSNAALAVKARGDAGSGGHGGGGLPTLEIALLTLAILTFAVLLINFIQQLLARMMMTMTGTTGLLGLGRRRRSLFSMAYNNDYPSLTSTVLSAIENPLFSKWYKLE